MPDSGDRIEFETRSSECVYEDGIFYVVAREGVHVALEDAQRDLALSNEKLPQGGFPMMVDMRRMASIDREAREFYSQSSRGGLAIALALMVRSPLSRVIASFFIGLNKPHIPVKIFNDRERAVAWLREMRDAARETAASV